MDKESTMKTEIPSDSKDIKSPEVEKSKEEGIIDSFKEFFHGRVGVLIEEIGKYGKYDPNFFDGIKKAIDSEDFLSYEKNPKDPSMNKLSEKCLYSQMDKIFFRTHQHDFSVKKDDPDNPNKFDTNPVSRKFLELMDESSEGRPWKEMQTVIEKVEKDYEKRAEEKVDQEVNKFISDLEEKNKLQNLRLNSPQDEKGKFGGFNRSQIESFIKSNDAFIRLANEYLKNREAFNFKDRFCILKTFMQNPSEPIFIYGEKIKLEIIAKEGENKRFLKVSNDDRTEEFKLDF